MLRQNRSLQSQYDGMMELRDIDSRRKNIQRGEYSRFKQRQLRRTRRIEGEGHVKDSEGKYESLESYVSTSTGRDNDRPSPDEDDRRASFEGEDQNLRTRANAFARRLNERLENIREQEGVIPASYRDAHRPTERSRPTASEPRTGDMPPGNPSPDVSQAPYTAPPRCGDLSVSTAYCGPIEEGSDLGEEDDPMGVWHPKPARPVEENHRSVSVACRSHSKGPSTGSPHPTQR